MSTYIHPCHYSVLKFPIFQSYFGGPFPNFSAISLRLCFRTSFWCHGITCVCFVHVGYGFLGECSALSVPINSVLKYFIQTGSRCRLLFYDLVRIKLERTGLCDQLNSGRSPISLVLSLVAAVFP